MPGAKQVPLWPMAPTRGHFLRSKNPRVWPTRVWLILQGQETERKAWVGAKWGHLDSFINMSIFLRSPKGSRKVVKNESRGPRCWKCFIFWRHSVQIIPWVEGGPICGCHFINQRPSWEEPTKNIRWYYIHITGAPCGHQRVKLNKL